MGDFLSSAFNTIINSNLWLAEQISRKLGINLPIIRVEFDPNNMILSIYYDQDIAPIVQAIILLIALAIFISTPEIIRLISEITTLEAQKVISVTAAELERQRTQLAQTIIDYCRNSPNPDCIKILPIVVNTPNPATSAYLNTINQLQQQNQSLNTILTIMTIVVIIAIGAAAYLYMVRR